MRGVVPLLLAALAAHSVVAAGPPTYAIVLATPGDDNFKEFPTAADVFSPLQETARGAKDEALDVDAGGRRPLKLSQNSFLGHRDLPAASVLRTAAPLPGADGTSSPSYGQVLQFDERLYGNLKDDLVEFARTRPAKEVAREASSIYERFFDDSFHGSSSKDQIQYTQGDFRRGRFRRSPDESKPLKKKIRSHFRVQSNVSDHNPGMDSKKNSARSFSPRRDDASSIETNKPVVKERSFQEKSQNEYDSAEDSVQQSSSYRYSPIGLRRDEDDRPDYYFQDSTRVYDETNEHQVRKPTDQLYNIHPEETGFHKFSFYESVDDFNKDFISTHPQKSQGSPDHLRSPYIPSKFKNAVEHKPPVKTQQYSEYEDPGININHESYSFSDPHPTDIVSESPYSPYTSSGTSNTEKTHYYDDKERTKDPHVSYSGSSPYGNDQHSTGKGKIHNPGGEKDNYYHSDRQTIYSPKKSNYDDHASHSPHHQYHGGNDQNEDHHNYRGSDTRDDHHGGSSHEYHHRDDYDDGRNFRGDNSHVSYSGNDQHGHHNAIRDQRYNHGDHKSVGYEDGHHGPHGPHSSRPADHALPYSKRASQTSSHSDHSLETSVGNSGSHHHGQNIHPSNYDRSPFKPSHEFSAEHGHGGVYSFYESNAGGRAKNQHSRIKEGSHSPHGPLNEGGDTFHVEENIADLPEFFGTGSHETDSHKFRNNDNFAPNDIESFSSLQLAEPYSRSPYTHGKRHTASYRQEKPFKQYENSLYTPNPSTFEHFRFQNSNKNAKAKFPGIQPQHALGYSNGAAFRSNPLPLNLPIRPRTRPPYASSRQVSGPAVGSSLMQFLNNLPAVNWSGRPTYRTLPNSFYR